MKNMKLQKMVTVGMLAAISALLMLFQFPIPPFPAFLQIDFSDVPALLATVTLGPVAGIAVALLKNIINWLMQGSPTGVPVGHIANFVTTLLFVLPVYFIQRRMKSKKGLTFGLVVGTITMAIGMSLLNYVAFMPMYNYFLNVPVETGAVLAKSIAVGILPFNIVKGVLLTIVAVVLFKALGKWITTQQRVYLAK